MCLRFIMRLCFVLRLRLCMRIFGTRGLFRKRLL